MSPGKRTAPARAAVQTVTLVTVCLLSLLGCQTTGRAVVSYPDGSRAEIDFKKGLFDDMDLPGPNPGTGRPDAYLRVGTSPVAANAALQGFRESGEALRKYYTDKAAQTAE